MSTMGFNGPCFVQVYQYNTSKHEKHQKQARQSMHHSKSRAATTEHGRTGSVEFVFVVVELEVSEAYYQEQCFDDWGHGYFSNRQVESEAAEVRIHKLFADPSTSTMGSYECAPCHEGRTLFNCGPFLPAVIADCDVVNIHTFQSPTDLDNAILKNPKLAEGHLANAWRPLRLQRGGFVTRVSTELENPKTVAPSASWVPSIVPEQYRDPNAGAQGPSQGLGGDFATIIGLMALGQAPYETSEAFANCWRGYQWSARRHSQSDAMKNTAFTGAPRGILVHMAIDPVCQDLEQALGHIQEVEQHGTIIYDSRYRFFVSNLSQIELIQVKRERSWSMARRFQVECRLAFASFTEYTRTPAFRVPQHARAAWTTYTCQISTHNQGPRFEIMIT
ncbi:hypothetical protein Micbo1qcDRAFT_174532 [Microdochium bolleyi]|uniref:Uncharacterized protein n=1 Tax=Microdochium bolleyi TaxID=196109 RepID=A0A136J8G8_9PEZI|nr:hypothetical protein Micbo1qcDRAFT_174532 [Microdochium bolleyi]